MLLCCCLFGVVVVFEFCLFPRVLRVVGLLLYVVVFWRVCCLFCWGGVCFCGLVRFCLCVFCLFVIGLMIIVVWFVVVVFVGMVLFCCYIYIYWGGWIGVVGV